MFFIFIYFSFFLFTLLRFFFRFWFFSLFIFSDMSSERSESDETVIRRNSSRRELAVATPSTPCRLCKRHHPLRRCLRFKNMNTQQRVATVREYEYCFNCLAVSHSTPNCTSSFMCAICGGQHHTMLHRVPYQQRGRELRNDRNDLRPYIRRQRRALRFRNRRPRTRARQNRQQQNRRQRDRGPSRSTSTRAGRNCVIIYQR